jgi:hypothetical protein
MTALMSPCGTYRYVLWREIATAGPEIAFIMLNPSTADERTDDPTIRRCKRFVTASGGSRLIVGNLFACRAANPRDMERHPDPVGADNDQHIDEIIARADQIICAWGARGAFQNRGDQILDRIRAADRVPYCLATTQGGQPAHPLYLPASARLTPYGGDREDSARSRPCFDPTLRPLY